MSETKNLLEVNDLKMHFATGSKGLFSKEKNYVYGQIEFDNLPMTFYSKYGDVIGNVFVLLGIITICFILVLAFRRNFNH